MKVSLKSRFPDVVIDFLFAVAVFAFGFTVGNSVYHPSYEQTEAKPGTADQRHKPEPFTLDWITEDGTVFFTAALAFIAIAQAGLFVWQLVYMRRGMRDSTLAAKAADLSARSAVALHLPLIRIRPDSLSHGDGIAGGSEYEECSIPGVKISNLGSTRAFPTEILYGWSIGDQLPPEPRYQYSDLFQPNYIIEPDPKITPYKRLTMAKSLEKGQWARITLGNYCWFYCMFVYDDFMDERRTHGFCWRWASRGGPGMEWIEERAPAYNRKT